MTMTEVLSLSTTIVVAIWGIYQTRITTRLQQDVHLLNLSLDQSIQRLHRARDVVSELHKAYVFLIQYDLAHNKEIPGEIFFTKSAELSSHKAELRGLAIAISDQEFLDLVNQDVDSSTIAIAEMDIRLKSQKMHTRIIQLLDTAALGIRKRK